MACTRGILLAGGSGDRVYPLSRVVCKQLLPVYDKPMIYYPLSTLMSAGIREILLISTPADTPRFRALLGDGAHIGIRIEYAVQEKPEGIAQAFIIGERFIGGEPVCLILGDNLLYGALEFEEALATFEKGARIFGYHVQDPARYGVLAFDAHGAVTDIIEKPRVPPSSYAVVGFYVYDGDVAMHARTLRPSARGELEISDLNRCYLQRGELRVEKLGRGVAWFDTGTPRSLQDAANFLAAIEERQGVKLACPEEIAFRRGYIQGAQLAALAGAMPVSSYRAYIEKLLKEM